MISITVQFVLTYLCLNRDKYCLSVKLECIRNEEGSLVLPPIFRSATANKQSDEDCTIDTEKEKWMVKSNKETGKKKQSNRWMGIEIRDIRRQSSKHNPGRWTILQLLKHYPCVRIYVLPQISGSSEALCINTKYRPLSSLP